MSGPERREKASDLFQKANFLIGNKVPFNEAFPSIADLRVEVVEDGKGVSDWSKKSVYTAQYIGQYIDCKNRLCYSGGVNVGSIIRFMVSQKSTEHTATEFCTGYEGSPKGRKNYGPCMNSFDIKIFIKYR